MLTDRLRTFVERVEQLPPEEQDRLLEQIEDALDDAQWHALLADPRSGPVLDDLIARARQSLKRPWPAPEDIEEMGDEDDTHDASDA